MSIVRELHNQAMNLAQQAMLARHEGKVHIAIDLAAKALEFEEEAAQRIAKNRESEPTRSILYRSAASLAFQAGDFARAQNLAQEGLAGYPPPQIQSELINLIEEVRHGAYLQQKGMVLDDSELQLSLKGNAVGIGIIEYEQFIQRIEALKALVTRTIQRLMGRKYQQRGRVAEIYNLYSPTLAIPVQSSFVMTFRLGTRQQDAPQLITATPARIFGDIITATKLINSEANGDIRRHFGKDEAYYRNFVSLVRVIAPDGEKVDRVSLITQGDNVSFTTTRDSIFVEPTLDKGKSTNQYHEIKIEGVIDYARRRRNQIGLTTEDSTEYLLVVEEGMDDIVRSSWSQYVTVIGVTSDNRLIFPRSIQPKD